MIRFARGITNDQWGEVSIHELPKRNERGETHMLFSEDLGEPVAWGTRQECAEEKAKQEEYLDEVTPLIQAIEALKV